MQQQKPQKLPTVAKQFFNQKPELKACANRFKHDVIAYLDTQAAKNLSARLSDIEVIAARHMTNLDESTKESYTHELILFLNSENVRIPTEFVISKRALKDIKNITFKTDEIGFNFDKSLLGVTADDDVWYDETTGRLSFTNLPAEFKAKLSAVVKENLKIRDSGKENG